MGEASGKVPAGMRETEPGQSLLDPVPGKVSVLGGVPLLGAGMCLCHPIHKSQGLQEWERAWRGSQLGDMKTCLNGKDRWAP